MNKTLLEKAKSLTMNGQNNIADPIYDQLLSLYPKNDEVIFYKAVNIMDSEPKKALSLFVKVLEINPGVLGAYSNIVGCAIKTNEYEIPIRILSKGINKYPNYPELVYMRGVLYGRKEEFTLALLDFYGYVDTTDLHSDLEKFQNHDVSRDIAISRGNQRNLTVNRLSPEIENKEKYKSLQFKEYNYTVPEELYGDENYIIDFGKMIGYTVKEVIQKQPDYISWCILNIDNFCVSEEIIEIIKRKGVDVSISEILNVIKLKEHEITRARFYDDGDGNLMYG